MWAAMDAWTSLPNLHPAVVHFPIALLPAALLFDLVCLLRPTWTWLDRGAAALYVLAAAGAGAAFWAGDEAAESLGPLAPAARAVLEEHENLARWTLIALSALALLRLALAWREHDRPRISSGPLRWILLLGGFGALTLLAATADHGGSLVYQHGVALKKAAPSEPAPPELAPPEPAHP
jgi:uncharacterized membrane protein